MNDRRPAEVFDPREFADEERQERGLKMTDFPPIVHEWWESTAPMPRLVAAELSRLLGGSMQLWLNLEASWQQWKETRDGE